MDADKGRAYYLAAAVNQSEKLKFRFFLLEDQKSSKNK